MVHHEQEINTYPWPQLLMEAGAGHHADKATDSAANGHPYF